MKTFTVHFRNEMTGGQAFRGTFESQGLAEAYIDQLVPRSRSFATFQVWIGKAGHGMKAVGELRRGAA